MTNMEIFSNANLEDMVINAIYQKYLIDSIKSLLSKDRAKKSVDIFRELYGIDCEVQNPKEISEKYGINKQMVSQAKIRLLISIYLSLKKENYYPSKLLEGALKSASTSCVWGITNKNRSIIEKIDFEAMDYLMFYDCFDGLKDSHKVLKRK